jgi:NAD(P)-dependent dehydrogenase (short-subunit alcohol dehydrogenase family)
MQNLHGKTAIVTGAGSGIGLGIARALARQGMALVLCDIRADSLEVALREVGELQARAVAVEADVSDRAAVERAAEAALTAFGAVHVAVNNAGVAMHGVPIESLSPREWDWVMGVNIGGVINGIQVFLPLIRAHGEAGHIVNTASIGGFQVRPGWHTGAYSMTKYAVVALSEELEHDLAGTPIGVSVLCPAGVQSEIYASARSRPARFGGPYTRQENHFVADLIKDGLEPDVVGARVVRGILDNEFYLFTHGEPRVWIEERHRRIMAAFEACERWRAEMRN